MGFSFNGNNIDLSNDGFEVVSSSEVSSGSFYFIQSAEPLSRSQKSKLQQDYNVDFLEYLGSNAWLCKVNSKDVEEISRLEFVKHVRLVDASSKISPSIRSNGGLESHDAHMFDIVLHQSADQSGAQLSSDISGITGISSQDMTIRHDDSIVRLKVQKRHLLDIAKLDNVSAIQRVPELELKNNVARGILHADIKVNNTPFRGEGQIITVADTGFDTGSIKDHHPAFKGRVIKLIPVGRAYMADDEDGHGTHVCGSAVGDGVSEPMGGKIQGTAPGAKLIVQSLGGDPDPLRNNDRPLILGRSSEGLKDLLQSAYDEGSRIHTNSWGPSWDRREQKQAQYEESDGLDEFIWKHQDLVVCFAAGNDGERVSVGPGNGHIGAQSAAKNCITVGSCDNARPSTDNQFVSYDPNGTFQGNPNHVSNFSSRGPTFEKRIKPDLVAPGAMILSTASSHAIPGTDFGPSDDSRWMYETGTSMATPLVAGCVAVVREYLIRQYKKPGTNQPIEPSAALIKAVLINGAVDLGLHRYEQGFGRVDVANSLFGPDAINKGFFVDTILNRDENRITRDIELKYPGVDPKMPGKLKVTLVYSDQQGANLQNIINLVVRRNKSKRHGNMGEAQDQYDNVNNVEQVVWDGLMVGDKITVEVSQREAMKAEKIPFAVVWSFVV